MYKNGDENVTMDALFSKYEDVSEKFVIENQKLSKTLDRILMKEEDGKTLTSRDKRSKRVAEINSRANSTYANNLDAIISQEASCENLIPLYVQILIRINPMKNGSSAQQAGWMPKSVQMIHYLLSLWRPYTV